MGKNPKETSHKVAVKAAKVLQKPTTKPDERSAAASALSQTPTRKKK
jgi:hypothetical protein